MVKLKVDNNEHSISELMLDRGSVSLGRATDNDVCLDDITVSSHHARIVTFFNATYIEDLGSTNGTWVNGKRIKMHTLHPGDQVMLGHCQLTLGSEENSIPQMHSSHERHYHSHEAA